MGLEKIPSVDLEKISPHPPLSQCGLGEIFLSPLPSVVDLVKIFTVTPSHSQCGLGEFSRSPPPQCGGLGENFTVYSQCGLGKIFYHSPRYTRGAKSTLRRRRGRVFFYIYIKY